MILFIVAGISLGAAAVEWWNRGRTEGVKKEIRRLEKERALILAEDRSRRAKIIKPYLRDLDALASTELDFRKEVGEQLCKAFAEAQEMERKQFGPSESDRFLQVLGELELAVAGLNAEVAHLRQMRERIAEASRALDTVPGPDDLALPPSFPRPGALFQLDSQCPSNKHGYRLRCDVEELEPGQLVAYYDVDHEARRARICPVRAALLSAALRDMGGEIRATVVERTPWGLLLEFEGTRLKLRTERGSKAANMLPGDELTCYPQTWTLSRILRAPRVKDEKDLLEVSTMPRIAGLNARDVWSPLPLRFSHDQYEAMVNALNRIEESDSYHRPWRVSLLEGTRLLDFRMGQIGLHLSIDADSSCFVLEGIYDAPLTSTGAAQIHAELRGFVEGSPDEATVNKSLFAKFVSALHAEIASQKKQMLQRRGALELRKLTMIYQDQVEHEERVSSLDLFVTGFERKGASWDVMALVLTDTLPDWFIQATGSRSPNVTVDSTDLRYPVQRIDICDEASALYRFTITPDDRDAARIDPMTLSRATNRRVGFQQRILVQSLEDTIIGNYASPLVREQLLELAGDPVPHVIEGADELQTSLRDTKGIFAVWGPPGTGKTTLIVEYLRQLLKRSRRGSPTILITAPTHVAVDEIMTRLLTADGRLEDRAVRYASEEKIQGSSLLPIWNRSLLDSFRQEAEKAKDRDPLLGKRWRGVLDTSDGREAVTRWFLKDRVIHSATCVGMARREFALTDRVFDLAIIDEAGKAFGAELLIPSRIAQRVIIVGDHRQLPPTITTEIIDGTVDYRLDLANVEILLRRNMFRQLFEQLPAENKGMLNTQHRMHRHIGDVISELFYGGRLSTGRQDSDFKGTRARLTFIDFSAARTYRSVREPRGRSLYNPCELDACSALLESIRLARNGTLPKTLVICPYKAQRRRVERMLHDRLRGQPVKAVTVDAVQGGEADLVLLLMTRNHGGTEFVLDEHRINVALSRARESVVILAHRRVLTRSGGPIQALIDVGVRRGTINLVDVVGNGSLTKRELRAVVG